MTHGLCPGGSEIRVLSHGCAADLNTAVSIQHDVSFLLCQVLAHVVGDGVGSQQEPALGPVFPLVPLLQHVALKHTTERGPPRSTATQEIDKSSQSHKVLELQCTAAFIFV